MLDRDRFFATVRSPLFGGSLSQGQVDGMTHLLDVWEASYAEKHQDQRFLAYALATAFHETARTMQPIEEIGKGRGRAYGHPSGPWRQVYDGRGDIQLTWETNYAHAQARLEAELGIKVALVQHPALAMDQDIAAHVMFLGMIEGWFTGKKLPDYFATHRDDPLHARRIVNGLDKASLIAGYHRAFLRAVTPVEEKAP